jgi:hypothetical protein
LRNCICGHSETEHHLNFDSIVPEKHWCSGCSKINKFTIPNMFHTFQLDNLSYVEYEAARRGLI